MRTASPAFTLVALLSAAVLVLGGGWWLSIRTIEKHTPPDRAMLRELATELQRELLRLEMVFQADIRELADATAKVDDARVRELCDKLYGIVQFSRLRKGGASHLVILSDSTAKVPIVLPPEDTSPVGDAPGFGWFATEDSRFWVVWKRISADEADAFLVDRSVILSRVDFALRHLIEQRHWSARTANVLSMVETSTGKSLAGLAEAPAGREPDMILPLVSRFGDWQVAAWNRTTTQTFHDAATLALASTISAVLAILGFLLFFQQRRASRLAEQRVSFVNRVSHELGTPLTNILLNLDLIEGGDSQAPDAARRRLRLVREEAQRLSRLVSNVLTFSRHERKRLNLNSSLLVPDDIVHSVLQQFQPALDRRGIAIQWAGAAKSRIPIDGDAFAQIVSNLVSNAEKYAAGGKRLHIESSMTDEELIVRVSDNGPGIPQAHASRVFEPFERADNRVSEGSAGAGLGLTIARELAHAMDGELRLLDNAAGASFELRLPIRKENS